jgi:hypothetical protein
MRRRLTLVLAVITAFGLSSRESRAQASASKATARPAANEVVSPSDMDLDLLRKDLRSQKKQIIAANLKLTDKEAEKFWPIYDQYTAETIKINDTKYGLIQKYAQNYERLQSLRSVA